MVFVVFDLDLTLGDFHSLYYYLTSIMIVNSYRLKGYGTPQVSLNLKKQLGDAYERFVMAVAQEERAGRLGLLRSGIIPFLENLLKLFDRGYVKGLMIYSNNGSLPTLQFVDDLFKVIYNRETVFCDLIHYDHPIRKQEIRGHPDNSAPKTWQGVSAALKSGLCAGIGLRPEEVIFVDDQPHIDLMNTLGSRYIHIQPYIYHVPKQKIATLFQNAINNSGLSANPEYNQVLRSTDWFVPERPNQSLLAYLNRHTGNTRPLNSRPPAQDNAFFDAVGKAVLDTIRTQSLPSAEPPAVVINELNPHISGGRRQKRKVKATLKKRANKVE